MKSLITIYITTVLSVFILLPSLIATTNATTNEQNDLKTFENQDYGFSIDYSKVFEPRENIGENSYSVWFDNLDSLGDPLVPQMLAILKVKPNNMTLTDYIEKDYTDNPLKNRLEEPTSITIDDEQGYKYKSKVRSSENPTDDAVVAHDDYIYQLTFITSGTSSDYILGEYLFDLMAESIRFT